MNIEYGSKVKFTIANDTVALIRRFLAGEIIDAAYFSGMNVTKTHGVPHVPIVPRACSCPMTDKLIRTTIFLDIRHTLSHILFVATAGVLSDVAKAKKRLFAHVHVDAAVGIHQ